MLRSLTAAFLMTIDPSFDLSHLFWQQKLYRVLEISGRASRSATLSMRQLLNHAIELNSLEGWRFFLAGHACSSRLYLQSAEVELPRAACHFGANSSSRRRRFLSWLHWISVASGFWSRPACGANMCDIQGKTDELEETGKDDDAKSCQVVCALVE